MEHLATYSTNHEFTKVAIRYASNLTSSNHQEVMNKVLDGGLLDRYLEIL